MATSSVASTPRRYVVFNVKNTTTPADIDHEFAKLYNSTTDRSLVFVFNMERIRKMTLPKLMQLIPLVRKYKKQSEQKLIETHVIIPEKWSYKLFKCFIALPVFQPARPVRLHRDTSLLKALDMNVLTR